MEKQQIQHEALRRLNEYALSADGGYGDTGRAPFSIKKDSLVSEAYDINFPVFTQAWAPQKDINTLMAQVRAIPGRAILFADFVNPVMAEKLRRRGVQFVDCSGNMYLRSDRLNAFEKRKKRKNLRAKRMRGRAFNTAGLKLIFAVFNQPSFLNASYRDISNKINIALGSVGPVINDLYASGYILDDGERKLVNKKRLFERWVDGYLEKLRPKQLMACYRSDNEKWWQKASPTDFLGVWGGEVIVAKATPFMMPETISLYFSSPQRQRDFASYYGLIEDDDGDICIYKKFWTPAFAGDDNDDGISPMIVYADIVDSINPGSWDVAKTFYGDYVAGLLKDD